MFKLQTVRSDLLTKPGDGATCRLLFNHQSQLESLFHPQSRAGSRQTLAIWTLKALGPVLPVCRVQFQPATVSQNQNLQPGDTEEPEEPRLEPDCEDREILSVRLSH